MPRGDGTGPTGQGRRTGKGVGPCGRNSQNPQDQGSQSGRRDIGRGKGAGGRGQSRGLDERTERTNDR